MYIDSHCHLISAELVPRETELLRNMRLAEVSHALCVCTRLPEFPEVLALAERHPHLYASVGVHPDYPDEIEPDAAQLAALADHPKVVAIGETGLDYFRLQGDLEWQRERFRTHIQAARNCRKPLIVHTRAAAADTITLMRASGADQAGGVMHCFTEGIDTALAAIDLGFMISFSGIVTFKNAHALREVVKAIPLDSLLIETDAPYLAPVPHRGRVNEPAFVVHVAECIAQLRGITVTELAAVTTANFHRLFRIPV